MAGGAEPACERRGLEEMAQRRERVPARDEPGPTTSDAGDKENLGARLLGWRGRPATVLANVILPFLGLPGPDGVGMGGGWLAALQALTWGQSPEPWCTVPPPELSD